MGFKRLFRFMTVAFLGGLGLFNSTKLEIRQITDTNAELIFQNGQIISSAIICLSLAGLLSELVLMRKGYRSDSEKIDLINSFFIKHLKIKAKIAVTGLNPHCESISRFNEDEKLIPLVIKNKIKKGINVKGPYPSDTLFLKKNSKNLI